MRCILRLGVPACVPDGTQVIDYHWSPLLGRPVEVICSRKWPSADGGHFFPPRKTEGPVLMTQCAIFIDGGYFAKVTEKYFNRLKVNFQMLSDLLSGSIPRLRTYYYDCMPYQGNPPAP